jgi:SAM-dependent methyltransferase
VSAEDREVDVGQFVPDNSGDAVSIEKWWELNHQEKNERFFFWLTGSAGPEVWEYLEVEDRIVAGAVVLNVGVGRGYCTRELAKRKSIVHVLDISESALEKVKDVAAGIWRPSTLGVLPADTFDLAISNLVAQHMRDNDLEEQIRRIVPALKQKGVFALQFACMLDPAKNNLDVVPLSSLKHGSVGRSLGRFCQMVERAGGIVIGAKRIGLFPSYNSCWYMVHIARPDYQGLWPAATARKFIRKFFRRLSGVPKRLLGLIGRR